MYAAQHCTVHVNVMCIWTKLRNRSETVSIKLCLKGVQTYTICIFCCHDLEINPMTLKDTQIF